MRKVFTIIFVLSACIANAQKKPAKTEVAKPTPPTQQPTEAQKQPAFNPLIEHYMKVRDLAVRWNDATTAKDALYHLIAETGNDSLAYLLAIDFYQAQQFAPAVLICKDLLQGSPKNVSYLELSAAGFEGLGLKDKALPNYESMYLLTESTAILYKMANLQYETKRFAESKANVEILLTKADLDKLSVNVTMPDKKSKDFPLKVAILNLKGLLANQAADKPGAKKAFEEALAIAADFPMAKDNLASLK